jgi:ribonuclease Y
VKHEEEIKQEVRRRAEADAARLVEEGKLKREAAIKQGELDAKELTLKAQREAEAELKERRANLEKVEERLDKREAGLDARAEKLDEREAQAKARDAKATRDEEALAKRVVQLDEREATIQRELERIAAMTGDEARKLVMDQIVGQASIDAAKRARQVEEEAMEEADRRAKRVISIAVQRWAGEYAAEKSVSVVSLPSDEMKGRIIGREGRNIRALEAATGVDVIIDDTPEAVIISGFDPVRREIARLTLEKLISDGRIHPSRIEEVVVKTEQEVAQIIKEAGERAAFELGIHGLHPELLKLLGRLKYRTSYGQNMWSHSIEVGFLCGLMAAELGVNVKAARRAGLLHDIGKAVTHEQEGSHAIIGADFCKKYGETELVRNAVAAHHNEEPQNSVIAHLVIAADSLSGARPGARREILETYIKRLEDLERISMGFEGVEKSYAIQAGREIRVLVQNSRVTDDQAFMLSRDIAKKIEDELTYPGQIKVTVIRETRAVEYAR